MEGSLKMSYPAEEATDFLQDFAVEFAAKVDNAADSRGNKRILLSLERDFHAAIVKASSAITEKEKADEMFLKRTLLTTRAKNKLSISDKIALLQNGADAYVRIRQKESKKLLNEAEKVLLYAANYADRYLGTSLVSSTEQILGCQPPWKENSSNIVVLNDIYQEARSLQDTNIASEWVAPSSFERSTTKYWVMNRQVNEVLCAAVAEAPLLVYGKSGLTLVSNEECRHPFTSEHCDQLWDKHAAQITSVYFDSPKMDLYKARLARQEGSNLLRVRWYGKRKPVGSEPIYLELKTHHEKWVNSKSIKERVTIQEKDMARVLDLGGGKGSNSKQSWTRDYAKKIVLAGTPTLKSKAPELEKGIDLLLRMRDLIVRLSLRACVRSKYQRAAFQSTKSNSLRLTLDLCVQLIDETKTHYPRGGNQWCLSDDLIAAGKCKVKTAPYGVFEVKLSGTNMPTGISDLIDGGSGALVEAEKFSKYQTGAAAFNQDKIETLPYWAADPSFSAMFGLPQKETDDIDMSTSRTNSTTGHSGNSSSNNDSDHILGTTALRSCLFPKPRNDPSVELFGVVSDRESTLSARKPRRKPDPDHSSSFSGYFRLSRNTSSTNKKIAPKQRVRVEPKSYFANERTFIQWISAALLLFTVSVILFDITLHDQSGLSHTAATFLIVCGMCLACYALFTYYRRLFLLQSGSPYGYVDHFGPVLITCSMLLGLGIYLSEVARGNNTSSLTMYQDGVTCHLHSLMGAGVVSPLAFEPSDLLYDQSSSRLLMVSFSEIISLNVSSGMMKKGQETTAKSIVNLGAGVDLEGLTMVGDVIYGLSERIGQNSMLYALKQPNEIMMAPLQVIGRWEVPMQDTEGITYIPDKEGGHGQLVIGSREAMETFDVPHLVNADPNKPLMPLTNVFNGRVVGYGADDTKIGALTFFEGVLYVLMDNSRIIRGWDLENGKILSQMNLPTVGGGFNRQWEGMALRRVSSLSSTGGVRGSKNDNVLVLDLALDTPGQIWSFVVEETAGKPGQFKLPDCAAASYFNHNATDLDTVAGFLNQ